MKISFLVNFLAKSRRNFTLNLAKSCNRISGPEKKGFKGEIKQKQKKKSLRAKLNKMAYCIQIRAF